jgi:acyl dehydratase
VAIDPRQLSGLKSRGERIRYGERDAMLYALGVGFGRDPGRHGELDFVFEGRGLKVVPTFASALARVAFLKGCGLDESRLVPAFERLTLHRPMPPAATLVLDGAVRAVQDLGGDAGALVAVEIAARNAGDDQPLFNVQRGILALADGGFGAGTGSIPAAHALPDRAPDLGCTLEVRPEQALIYRLSGDLNPLHADPAAARRYGLPGPIMQNLCTFGTACRGLLETICDFDPTLITAFECRYTGPVYPGDTLAMELWQDANVVSFRVRVPVRSQTVLDHGRCILAA